MADDFEISQCHLFLDRLCFNNIKRGILTSEVLSSHWNSGSVFDFLVGSSLGNNYDR